MSADKKQETPDWYDDYDDYEEDDEQEEYDYYYCYGCFFSTIRDYGGWGCPKCGAIMSGEYY